MHNVFDLKVETYEGEDEDEYEDEYEYFSQLTTAHLIYLYTHLY